MYTVHCTVYIVQILTLTDVHPHDRPVTQSHLHIQSVTHTGIGNSQGTTEVGAGAQKIPTYIGSVGTGNLEDDVVDELEREQSTFEPLEVKVFLDVFVVDVVAPPSHPELLRLDPLVDDLYPIVEGEVKLHQSVDLDDRAQAEERKKE